jgi:hypothetical protein
MSCRRILPPYRTACIFLAVIVCAIIFHAPAFAHEASAATTPFPRALETYHDTHLEGITEVLVSRIKDNPFNLVATIIFICAIAHTLLALQFRKLAEYFERRHAKKPPLPKAEPFEGFETYDATQEKYVGFRAEMMHLLSEVEAVFGIWAIPLMVAIFFFYDWNTAITYINTRNFTEPLFVVVIMSLAATRPIIKLVESSLQVIADIIGKGSLAAWWLTILTVTPLLGSFITEPGAMTIGALLLGRKFYQFQPSKRFAYATLGLLFVNISVGGVLTHFAAPPVLMISEPWHWGSMHMFTFFGWKAVLGITLSNLIYFSVFRSEFKRLNERRIEREKQAAFCKVPVPLWITIIHILLLAWIVLNAHNIVIFIGTFLLFLGFHQATMPHQYKLQLRTPILVGFFLAGLVIHGGLQAWWISTILNRLSGPALMFIATALTAFNDNAIITYLATLVPDFTGPLKYAIVAGAVAGGGLTVIANAPNPAGQMLLQKYFGGTISPLRLFLAAALPTTILFLCFLILQ